MHSPQQCDAQRQPVCSRRIFLGSALAASASVVAGALAGCQRPSTLKVVQPTTGGGRDDLSDSVIGKDKIRIGMEAAYAPYNWQVSEASEFTIPIDNVQGAYADGYDVQIAKIVCKALGGEPVAVKQSFSGLIDSLNNGQIDLIIAGMSATPEREESVGFSDPYFIGYFGLFVKEGSPTKMPPSSATLAVPRYSAKRTPCSIPSSTRSRALCTRTRSIRFPRCSRICCRARATP